MKDAPPAAEQQPEAYHAAAGNILDVRCPAFLVFSSPHLHGLRIVLDLPIFRVELQLPVYLPRDVGKLKHSDSHISYRDRSVERLSLADSRYKVGEVHIGHRVAAGKVRRRGRLAGLEFARL